MKKNANLANKRNRRRRNAFALAALLGAALFVLPTDAAKADDFGFSLNLGCFSLNIGNNDDCCDHAPLVVAPAPAPRPLVVAPPAPAPRPIVVAPPKPAPRPIVVAPAKPAPRPIVVAPAKPAPPKGKAPQIAARPTPGRGAVVRGQAPAPRR